MNNSDLRSLSHSAGEVLASWEDTPPEYIYTSRHPGWHNERRGDVSWYYEDPAVIEWIAVEWLGERMSYTMHYPNRVVIHCGPCYVNQQIAECGSRTLAYRVAILRTVVEIGGKP